jgi:transcription termination factor NusB
VNPRRQGRELAFRAVYQSDVTGDTLERCLSEILEATPPGPDAR